MCGLVGIAGKLEHKDEATMKRLLVYDVFRGPDSTGLATLKNTGETTVVKLASHPLNLFLMKPFDSALSGHNSTVFLGHNRLATKGQINDLNAHPFTCGHIVGAHNGTLDKSSWEKLEELIEKKTEVDSHAVFLAIEKLGIEETVKHLSGAWALVWINTQDGTLNFLRNKERPLWYAYDEGFKKVLWASEWPMIQAACKMALLDYKLEADSDGHHFFNIMTDWWYRFDLTELREGGADRPKPRVKELKGKEPAPAYSYTGVSNFHGRSTTASTTKTSTTTSQNGFAGRDKSDNFSGVTSLDVIGNKSEPFGGFLSKERFDDFAKYGCSWCGTTVEYDEPGVTVIESVGAVKCPSCSEHGTNSRLYVEDWNETIKVAKSKAA